jgi:hypothetical protein
VPGHQIPLATFIRTSQQTEAALRGLTKGLFGDDLQFELHVLPPEDGTFLTRLAVVIAAIGAPFWVVLESDVGKGFIKGLTGHEPAYWSEELGKRAHETARNILSEANDGPLETRVTGDHQEAALEIDLSYETLIVCEMAKSFLQKDNTELARAGIGPRNFRDAFEAKNEFYQACAETPQLKAIGFSEEAEFPIKRPEFLHFQIQLPPKDEVEVEHPWYVGRALLKVTSPNWDRNDRMRLWKAHDQRGRDRYFSIEDEEFWLRAGADMINTHIIDLMEVQWIYQGTLDQPKNCRAIRIIKFNEEPMSQPLSDAELEVQFGKLTKHNNGQGDLFQH